MWLVIEQDVSGLTCESARLHGAPWDSRTRPRRRGALNDSIPNITRARRFMAKIELRLYNKDQITRPTSTREARCARHCVCLSAARLCNATRFLFIFCFLFRFFFFFFDSVSNAWERITARFYVVVFPLSLPPSILISWSFVGSAIRAIYFAHLIEKFWSYFESCWTFERNSVHLVIRHAYRERYWKVCIRRTIKLPIYMEHERRNRRGFIAHFDRSQWYWRNRCSSCKCWCKRSVHRIQIIQLIRELDQHDSRRVT